MSAMGWVRFILALAILFPSGIAWAQLTGGVTQKGPVSAGEAAVWSERGRIRSNQSGSPNYRINDSGFTFGMGSASAPAGNPIQIINSYSGAPNESAALFTRTDYQPNANDTTNSTSLYGTLWVDAPYAFSGSLSAVKGNSYVMAQITATVASGGSGNVVGDVLTITGGTCTNGLNTAPTFGVTGVSGGAVTSVTFYKGTGACGTYPTNPVSTTSSRGGATPPTLNLTISASPTITNLIGTYGRVRNQSSGTVTNAYALYADGLYNTGAGGVVTNSYGLFVDVPHTTGNTPPVNDYGVFFNGNHGTGSIAASSGSDITINTSGGGKLKYTGATAIIGSTGGSYTSPTSANTNLLLYEGSSTNYAGFGVHIDGGIYGVTGTTAPATRWQILPGGGVQIGPVRAALTAGAFGLNKITASGTAPGAGTAKLEVVAGTNAGTCKLVMAAGTSGTAVTVVDNVGTGC